MGWILNAIIVAFMLHAGWYGMELTIGGKLVLKLNSMKEQINSLKKLDS